MNSGEKSSHSMWTQKVKAVCVVVFVSSRPVEASRKGPAPRSEIKRRNAPSFLSGGRARAGVPSRRHLSVFPIMPDVGFLALRLLSALTQQSRTRERAHLGAAKGS